MKIDKKKVATRFCLAAKQYAKNAVLQKTVAERLLERLQLISMSPEFVVDVGSGTGEIARQLKKQYKNSKILQLDLALEMLKESKNGEPRFFWQNSGQNHICADVENLPLKDRSVDMVFSSLMLQWCSDLDRAFVQIERSLKNRGLFLFATLGPDTLKELRESWAEVDEHDHVNTFIDMHDVGDALVRAGFVEPVMDTECITMTYEDCMTMMRDLKTLGANNSSIDRQKGLTGKNKMSQVFASYEKHRVDGRLPATYEIVYGHAWIEKSSRAVGSSVRGKEGEIYVPVTSIKEFNKKN